MAFSAGTPAERGIIHLRTRFSMDFESYSDCVAFLKIFGFANTRFDGHNITVIFRPQGSLPFGFADSNRYGDHSPAIGHQAGDGVDITALFFRNSHEEPRCGSPPKPNYATELDVHWHSISNAE